MKLITAAATAAVLTLSLAAAQAATETVSARLTGAAETPADSSKGTGTLTGTYDPANRLLTYDITYQGLSGPAIAAHFHAPAPAGKAAGIEIPIKGSVASPIKGSVTLDVRQAKNLTDGMTYINIHTEKNPKGELRGQIKVDK